MFNTVLGDLSVLVHCLWQIGQASAQVLADVTPSTMNSNSWQHPFVNIFKHFDIDSAKKCSKQGDVASLIVIPEIFFVVIDDVVFSSFK